MKLNNKGYMIIEIVMASMIAFGIAYFLFDLTLNIKNKSDKLQAETIIMGDRAIIENYIMKKIKESTDVRCNTNIWLEYTTDKRYYIGVSTNSATNTKYFRDYDNASIENYHKSPNEYVKFNGFQCIESDDDIKITMSIEDKLDQNKKYDINLTYIK